MGGKREKTGNPSEHATGDELILAWIMTGIALFASAIGWVIPILFIGIREVTPFHLLLLSPFLLVSLWFMWGAVEVWLRLIRWGRTRARLEPVPPRAGEPLAVTVGYDRAPSLPRDCLGVLVCEQRTTQGRSRSLALWRQEVRAVADGPTVRFIFTPPRNLPPAGNSREGVVVWRLLVQSTEPYMDREFHLPVEEAAEEPDPRSEALREEARGQRTRADDRASVQGRLAEAGIQLMVSGDRGRIHLKPARHRGLAVGMLLLALIFGAGGLLALSSLTAQEAWGSVGRWAFSLAFIGGAAAAFATFTYRFLDRRMVEWSDGRLRVTWRHLLDRGEVEVPVDRIRGLKPWVSYQSGTREGPNPMKESIAIAAVTDDGRLIPLVDGVPSRWDAEGLLEALAGVWGVPKEGLGTFDQPPGYRPEGKHVIWRRARGRVLGSGAVFAGLLVLGALTLRVDVGEFEAGASFVGGWTVPISAHFGQAPPGTVSSRMQEARALAREAAANPPYAAAVAGELDLSGTWTLVLPAGHEWEARLLRVWTDSYEIVSPTVLDGRYELQEGDLVVTEPSNPRLTGLVWRATAPDRLVLIEAPPASVTGSDYTGAVLVR